MTSEAFNATRFWSIMTSILLLIFLLNIDYTAVTMTLTPIAKELNIDLNILQWLLSSYVLLWGALVVPCGRLADMYGKKKMFLIGTSIFALGSLVLGLGQSIWVLIGGRLIQGLGGALMSAPCYSIIFSAAPKHMQGFAIGILTSASGVGLSVGPPFSAWIIEEFGWRWIFLMNVPLCLIVVAFCSRLLDSDVKSETKQHINYFVAFMLTAGLALFFFGLNQFEVWGWQSLQLWGVIFAGIFSLIMFYQLDHRLEPDPQNQTLPKVLINNKPYRALLYVNFAICFIFSLTLIAINLLLQNVYEMSITETGLFMLWFTLIMGILSPVSGKISDKIGLKAPIWLGTCFMLLGCAFYLFISREASSNTAGAALFLVGTGISLMFSPLNTMMFRLVPEKEMNTGAGLFTAAMMIGHTFAAIIVTSLLVYWGIYVMPQTMTEMGTTLNLEQQAQITQVMGQAKHDLTQLTDFSASELEQGKNLLKELFVKGFHINVILGLIMMTLAVLNLYLKVRHVNLSAEKNDVTPAMIH